MDLISLSKIKRVQDNLDALVIGQFGTGFVTDAMLNESGIKATVANRMSQSEKSGLSGWFRDLVINRNKKICCVGDSTTDSSTGAQYIWNTITNECTGSGDGLEGIAFVNRGSNGNTLANCLNNTPVGKGINDIVADQADLYILSYGINDVRLGATTQQQLIDLLDTAIQRILKDTKGYVLLRIPNSFLLDDPGSTGLVQPLASAQAYTDLIWNAYMSFKGKYARVDVLDTQTLLFGRTCLTAANNPLMNDILHPNTISNGGYIRLGRLIADYIGTPQLIRNDLIQNAIVQNAAKPYLVYPKYLENKPDKYELIAQGYFIGMGSNYLDFGFDGTQAYKIQLGDIIKVGDVLAYDIPGGYYSNASGNNTRIGGFTYTNYANNNKGMVKIYRKKGSQLINQVFKGTNISGQQLGIFSLPVMRISVIKSVTTSPISNTIDLKLREYYQNTAKDIATIHFDINNMTATTITWDATNAPNSYYDTKADAVYSYECTSTSYTGTAIFNLSLS